MTTAEAYVIGIIVGSLLGGALVGLIPLICGLKKKKKGLAIGGFFACMLGGFIRGIVLAAVVCAVFMFLIFKKSGKAPSDDQPQEMM